MKLNIMFFTAACACAIGAGIFLKPYKEMRWVQGLGAGINVGNSLDVVRIRKHRPDATLEEYETFWGNPQITQELMHTISERGFRTVRLPVSWGEHLDGNGKIEEAWMNRVSEVVGWALNEQLYVILDMHHEEWLIPTEDQEAAVTKKLCSLWEQIAGNFQGYGEQLIFEGMNEPRLENSAEEWTAGTSEMQQVVNRLNQAFVHTVRAAGGENGNRWLIIPAYCSSSKQEALEALRIPEKKRVLVAVHAYLPYPFTSNEDGSVAWSEENPADTEQIDDLMENLDRLFLKKKIPVVITEFGCSQKPEEEERLAWTSYYLKKAGEKGIPCIWWDNGKESGILDRDSMEWISEPLIDVLLEQNGMAR